MRIRLRPLAEIKPYERNPRIHGDAVAAVAESIRRFGFRQPIVVDADGVIICGHARWQAAQTLGLERVPVHVACDLTPEQVRAYRIADNKTAELATWNTALLAEEIRDLDGFDLHALGFGDDELEELQRANVKLTNVDCQQPKRAWVLIGIAVERYGELIDVVDKVAAVDGVILHTTITDISDEDGQQ